MKGLTDSITEHLHNPHCHFSRLTKASRAFCSYAWSNAVHVCMRSLCPLSACYFRVINKDQPLMVNKPVLTQSAHASESHSTCAAASTMSCIGLHSTQLCRSCLAFYCIMASMLKGPSALWLGHAAHCLWCCGAESWLMLRQELVRTVASRQMQLVGLPHNVQRVRRVSREVSFCLPINDCSNL